MWVTICVVFIVILCLLYYISTRNFRYWKNKNVPHPEPVPLLGNYGDYILLKTYIGNVARRICQQFPKEPYIGVYYGTEPTLLVQDPELLKLILTKDFYYFNGREASHYSEKEALTKGMFFNHGDHWKIVRQNLTPLFSAAKMKNMFPLIEKCCLDLDNLLQNETKVSNVFEMNTLMSRYTLDCVGSCAFGIEMNVLQPDYENNPYKKIAETILGQSDFRGYLLIARSIWPWLFYGLGYQMFPSHLHDAMEALVINVCDLRQNKAGARNDFIDLLLTLKAGEYMVGDSMKKSTSGETNKIHRKVDTEIMTAMCLAFFGGGYETSSTTLALTLFELAKNLEIQLKVQKEVDDYLLKHNNKVDYDCVSELPLLAACVDETLRLYPLFSVITREVMEDYTLPTGVKLDKGVRIHIPVEHMHYDPQHFPEPYQFRPERFLPEEKHKIKPYTYFPFGEGPRICIGLRFGRMEVSAGLVTVLKNYQVKLAKGMSKTIDFDPRLLVSHTKDGVYLEFERRKH